jgi:hypothetical protein
VCSHMDGQRFKSGDETRSSFGLSTTARWRTEDNGGSRSPSGPSRRFAMFGRIECS